MKPLNERQQKILLYYTSTDLFTSSQAQTALNISASLVTIRRDIRELVEYGYLTETGAGRSLKYHKTILGALMTPIDAQTYQATDIDIRSEQVSFRFEIFSDFPESIFTQQELTLLDAASLQYKEKNKNQTPSIQAKELERFIIELSWKSSKIEGNTYTLLDTELLIREGIPAEGRSQDETTMILNHKRAFSFVMEHKSSLSRGITQSFVEKIHQLLTDNLSIDQGIRKTPVGITGTNYVPLETEFHIKEALEVLYTCINASKNTYQKALLALVGISYIQPFADGNKRTARLLANAFLIAEGMAPLSYRNVDEKYYREAILVFYELNSIVPMKNIFIEQYLFSTKHYFV